MDYSSLDFYSEDIEFLLPNEDNISSWVNKVTEKHTCKIENVSIIFCSDEFLLDLNQQHLHHDFYTDILTFPFHEKGTKWLMGDIFISIDRVRENAVTLKTGFVNELHTVIIHGILHLIGFNDESEEEEREMRMREDEALALRDF